jgi:6-pyruvoyl-tetrahydropterin synthase-like protein
MGKAKIMKTWSSFKREEALVFILLGGIAAVLLVPIAANTSIPNIMDIVNHLVGIIQAKNAFLEGQFVLRTAPSGHYSTFRYPFFQFYSPTSYMMAGAIYHWIVPSNPFIAFKLVIWGAFVTGGIYIDRLARYFVLSRPAALLGAVVYLTAPYHIIVINHLGNLTESLALGMVPSVIFYTLQRYDHPRNDASLLKMAFVWYLLATIHIITFMCTSIFVFIFLTLITFRKASQWNNLLHTGLAYFLSCILAMWYLGPIAFYSKILFISDFVATSRYPSLLMDLLSPIAVISRIYHSQGGFDLLSQIHPSIGLPILMAVFLCTYLLISNQSNNKKNDYFIKSLLILFFIIFFIIWSPINFWKWLPPSFGIIQYTWRLVGQTVWIGSLLFAWAVDWVISSRLKVNGQAQSFLKVSEQPQPFLKVSEQPQLFLKASEQPQPFLKVSEQPPLFLKVSEQPQLFLKASEQPPLFLKASEQPQPFLKISEQPRPFLKISEQPRPLQKNNKKRIAVGIILIAMTSMSWFSMPEHSFMPFHFIFDHSYNMFNPDVYLVNFIKNGADKVDDVLLDDSFIDKNRFLKMGQPILLPRSMFNSEGTPFLQLTGSISVPIKPKQLSFIIDNKVVDNIDLKSKDLKTVKIKSVNQQSATRNPAEPESADLKSVHQQSAILKPVEPKSADLKSVHQQSAILKQVEPKSADLESVHQQSAILKPVEPKSADLESVHPKTAILNPVQPKSADLKSLDQESGQLQWKIPLSFLNQASKNQWVSFQFKMQGKEKTQSIAPIKINEMVLSGFLTPKKTLFLSQVPDTCQQKMGHTYCKIDVPKKIEWLELPVFYYPEMLNIVVNGRPVAYESILHGKYLIVGIRPQAGVMNDIDIQFRGLLWANFISDIGWSLWAFFAVFLMLQMIQRRFIPR